MSDTAPSPDTGASTGSSIAGWLQVAVVIGVLVGAFAVTRILSASVSGPERGAVTSDAPVVAIITPRPQTATVTVSETGTVRARADVSIAPQVGGRVVEVADSFAAGGAFAAGDTLFRIDPTDFELTVRQAQADLASAQSALELELAEAETAKREWRLVNGDEPIPALVAREPQIAQARASVAGAQARVGDARVALERTRYSLPFDGRVIATTIEMGQTLAPNQPYGTAYRVEALEAFVALPAEDIARLDPVQGRTARITAAGGRAPIEATATVARVDASLDARTRLAGVTLRFDSPPPFLPGAFVGVTVVGDTLDGVFEVPADIIGPGDRIWVVDGEALEARTATVLARGDDTAIVAAFDVADGVVVTAPAGAREGLVVRAVAQEGEA